MYVDAFGKAAWEMLADKLGLEEDTELMKKVVN